MRKRRSQRFLPIYHLQSSIYDFSVSGFQRFRILPGKLGVTSSAFLFTLAAMKSLPRLAVAAVLLAASAAGRAQTIADLPDDKFKSLVEKTALYTKALSAARTVQKSYDRYAAWVAMR